MRIPGAIYCILWNLFMHSWHFVVTITHDDEAEINETPLFVKRREVKVKKSKDKESYNFSPEFVIV